MTVHSQPAAQAAQASAAPEFPRHVVTAVIVSHDGARWLPDALGGLLGQTRPVQNVIGADTGSADDSARLLTEALGDDRVLHLARRTGFGTAVDEAHRSAPVLSPEDLPYLRRPSSWDPVSRTWRDEAYEMPELPHGEPVQWLWLLHDDCAPEPEALAELLRVADASPATAVVGPKLRSWYDRRQLLEVGVSIARSGRRWTGLDRREQDQGQHDQIRPVLSVSSAGMLVRRDVYEQLGGFDRRLPLMRDDVDLCWRVQAAGHQVLVAPDAVLRHAEAASRERRPIDCVGRAGRTTTADAKRFSLRGSAPHRVDKAGAVYTLLANTPGKVLPYVVVRLVLGTLLRMIGYLVGKVPGQALDELSGLLGTLLRPGALLAARRRRGKPAVPAAELRPLFPPVGATVRATVEQVVGDLAGRTTTETSSVGRHGAVESGPGDDDAEFLEIEQFARLKRIARAPAPVLFLVLLLVSLIACRSLLGSGSLAGGALLPAPAGVGDLWASYLQSWHTVGVGSTASAPPYLAVLALVATLCGGSTALALTLLMVFSVPLAGLTAYFASRPLVTSRLLRAWASVVYAFLPAATGALAGGRLGTAVLAILAPLMARAAVAAAGLRLPTGARPSWRATWAYTLLATFTTAFTPVIWPLTLLLGLALLVRRLLDGSRAQLPGYALRTAAAVLTPLVVLAPWSLSLLSHPSHLLTQAGLPDTAGQASPTGLLLELSPGGPATAGGLLLVGVVLAAVAATLRAERHTAIRTAWAVAALALLTAAVTNGSAWAGPSMLLAGLALLSAAALGTEGIRTRMTARGLGWQQPVAVLIAACCALAPVYAAVTWMIGGADGPVERRDATQVPAFVAEEARTSDQPRTLVLDGTADHVRYALVRGSGARLGDADLARTAGRDTRLDGVVAHLVAGSGADQTSRLGQYAVRYVLAGKDADRGISRVLNTTPGLTRLSQEGGQALWRVDQRVSRVSVVDGKAAAGQEQTPVPVAAGPVEVHTTLRSGAAGRVLRLADAADDGWEATLDGQPLTPVTLDGWAQGFKLPTTGGTLDVTHSSPLGHILWTTAQGLLALVLVVLALPGRRRDIDDDLPEEPLPATATAADGPLPGEGRRARRLRAAQSAGDTPEAPAAPQSAPGGPGAADEVFAATDPATGAPLPEGAIPHQGAAPDPFHPGSTDPDTGSLPPYDPAQPGPYGEVPHPQPYGEVPHQQPYGDQDGYAHQTYQEWQGGQYYPADAPPGAEQWQYQGAYEDGTHGGTPYGADPYAYPQAPAHPAQDPYGNPYPAAGYQGADHPGDQYPGAEPYPPVDRYAQHTAPGGYPDDGTYGVPQHHDVQHHDVQDHDPQDPGRPPYGDPPYPGYPAPPEEPRRDGSDQQ
ncbi:glycosyltransferase [Streptomyces sp. NPDC059740]|uniref:glycosyltransferase n=1 Tax=Streptomyces sp. NPDC059740 TaxID=3346926 RepID=UPI00365B6603